MISLITLLPEPTYRRLLSIQSQLLTTLEHPCGLNPKSYRLGTGGLSSESSWAGGIVGMGSSTGGGTFGGGASGGGYGGAGGGGMGVMDRAVLDGNLVGRFFQELDVARRMEIVKRAGTTVEELKEDLRAVGIGDGAKDVLGYL